MEEAPRNPNYYLIINEFKVVVGGQFLSARRYNECFDIDLTFNVYIFTVENIFTLERKIYETVVNVSAAMRLIKRK